MANTITTPADIQMALTDREIINMNPHKWASLELAQFPSHRVVRLSVGNQFMGNKTIATHYINYTLQKDGSVYKGYTPAL